jgi:pyrroloquinoline-quinone synthase
MPNIIDEIDAVIEQKSLLKHRFYKAWSEGKLTNNELARYSMEYFQLVKEVPNLVQNIRSKVTDQGLYAAISKNLEEEGEHIAPWILFARSLGVAEESLSSYEGTSETNGAVSEMVKLTQLSFEEAVASMYAYEKELPKISRSKLDGLQRFYGLSSYDATHYFNIHEVADVRHADLWRSLLQKVPKEKEAELLSSVKKSMDAQNKLLDSVTKKYCKEN